jgi:CBS domain-containing protein
MPLLLVRDLMKTGVPVTPAHHDLATVLDLFENYDTDHLPVTATGASGRVIGLISRAAVMRRYQRELTGTDQARFGD